MLIFSGAVPVLQVEDVAKSVAWYASVLGFAAGTFPDAPPYSFAILNRDRAEVMLQRRGPSACGGPGVSSLRGWSIYLRLRGGNLLAFAAEVGVKTTLARGPERMPYGQVEFEVIDPDGHRICVAESLPAGAPVPEAPVAEG